MSATIVWHYHPDGKVGLTGRLGGHDPTWLPESGEPRPTRGCIRCGRETPVYRFREEHLRLIGRSLYTVASYTNWCGHGQEFIPLPGSGRLGAACAGWGEGGVAPSKGARGVLAPL